jgi:hypothetical protein
MDIVSRRNWLEEGFLFVFDFSNHNRNNREYLDIKN